jgi:hypothetical protein
MVRAAAAIFNAFGNMANRYAVMFMAGLPAAQAGVVW